MSFALRQFCYAETYAFSKFNSATLQGMETVNFFFHDFFSSILAEAPRPCESTECCGPPTTSSGTSWNRQGVMMAASQSLLSILMLRLLFLVPCLRQL